MNYLSKQIISQFEQLRNGFSEEEVEISIYEIRDYLNEQVTDPTDVDPDDEDRYR